MNISCEIACNRILWLVYIGSGNGLVPSGNKQLPEPVLYANMWSNDRRHFADTIFRCRFFKELYLD